MEFLNDEYERQYLNSVQTPFSSGHYEPDPTFWQTVGASLDYQYQPSFNYIRNRLSFEDDITYNPLQDIEGSGYEEYEDDLIHAVSREHMNHLKLQIEDYKDTRETLSNSSLAAQFGAALFDPLNWIALPFGGPSVGMVRSAVRVGLGAGVVQAGLETVRHPFDPLSTPEEVMYNIGGATAMGGLLGTVFSAPMTMRWNAMNKTEMEQLEFMKQVVETVPESHAKFIGQRENPERTFGRLSDKELNTIIEKTKLEKTPASENARIELGAERALRKVEADLPKDHKPFDIVANAFTNSWIYKAVPTSLKHTLQNNYTMNQKKSMLGLIGDMGTYIGINKYGGKTDTSVHIEASTFEGEWVQSYNQLLKLYGRYTGKGVPLETKADLLFFRKGFDEFVEDLSAKRIRQDFKAGKLTPIDREGINILDDFFDTWGNRLQEQNLILRNKEQVQSEIKRLEKEIKETKSYAKNKTEKELRNQYESRLKTQLSLMQRQLSAFPSKEVNVGPLRFNHVADVKYEITQRGGGEFEGKKPARYNRESNTVHLSIDGLERMFQEKAWTKPKVVGVKALPKDSFKTFDDWFDFVKMHETMHAKHPMRKSESKAVYENRINKNALEEIKIQKRRNLVEQGKIERFFPRLWDKTYIKDNREAFSVILRKWYKDNPYVYRWDEKEKSYVQKKLITRDDAIEERVQETIDTILDELHPTTTENISFGSGQSNHFKHRQLDIPNHLVEDFILKNPVKIMMGYTNRVAAQYSFAKKFGDSDAENVMLKLGIEAAREGQSMRQVLRFNKNFRHGYDRVVGSVLRNPLAFNQQAAQVMKDLAALNYLGSAGFSTLPDAAVVLMQNELKPVFKQLFRVLDNEKVRMNAMEGQLAGEILDTLKGEVMLRLMEDMTNNPFQSNLRSKAKNAFFQLNLLGPATGIFKRLSSMANVHTILEYSIKLSKGEASVKQRQHLARIGIDLEDAKKIAKQKWETENGVHYANATQWKDKDVLFKFRTALNASIKHQVLMGTPADKPIAVDGIFYVPNHVARYIPFLKPDQRFQGYSRIENGLLGLPFQFYSYSFAALNKVTVLATQGQVTNRFIGMTSAMGLAYMGMQLKYRNNPWILDNMSIEDKIARSFDMSGLGAIYSDMFYTSLHTSLALGGPNIGGGIINPKFPQQPSYLDAASGIMGAGPSISIDLARAAGKFAMGETGEGAKEFIRNLPFARLWFLKELTNDMTRAIAGGNRY